ncbi:MAG: hypothetical protein Q4A27_00790 [bacterium]|nr:hypothetical protein [bacterium]
MAEKITQSAGRRVQNAEGQGKFQIQTMVKTHLRSGKTFGRKIRLFFFASFLHRRQIRVII